MEEGRNWKTAGRWVLAEDGERQWWVMRGGRRWRTWVTVAEKNKKAGLPELEDGRRWKRARTGRLPVVGYGSSEMAPGST
jgi:hypothetical protein